MQRPFVFQSIVKKQLADTVTPVSIYLRLRDQYPNSFLLESTDDQPNEPTFSYICCDSLAEFRVQNQRIFESFPNGESQYTPIKTREQVAKQLQAFLNRFECKIDPEYSFLNNGLFGYLSYDCIQYFDELEVQEDPDKSRDIPDALYHMFRYIIAIDHHKNEMYLLENQLGSGTPQTQGLESLAYKLTHRDFPTYPFQMIGEESSNFTDGEYHDVIEKCKHHIRRGDVFQIVPSRRFSQSFLGDEFNVYRALRSINPSPYLFYFDYGSFKIFGSSPEAHLVIKEQSAWLYPIAGTYKRTGDEKVDKDAVEALKQDPKENAEHVMLVDLARNDLSKHCYPVEVEEYKQVQRYSHVIHLTSKVHGKIKEDTKTLDLLQDTFPMGTLSGAPKYRALQLINQLEKGRRRAYGGAIGCLGFDNSCNHAIIIRSFLSKGNILHCQAGGGIVADSDPASEMQEIKNKLGALKASLAFAETIVPSLEKGES